jgi:hypothetical protein
MKGLGLFLEAAHVLQSQGVPARFLLAGGDPDAGRRQVVLQLVASYNFTAGTLHVVGHTTPHLTSGCDGRAECGARAHAAGAEQAAGAAPCDSCRRDPVSDGPGPHPDGPTAGSRSRNGRSFVARSAVPATLACMDVFVAPYVSPSCETQGIAVLEAMAMGLPVVHFGVGGLQVSLHPPSNGAVVRVQTTGATVPPSPTPPQRNAMCPRALVCNPAPRTTRCTWGTACGRRTAPRQHWRQLWRLWQQMRPCGESWEPPPGGTCKRHTTQRCWDPATRRHSGIVSILPPCACVRSPSETTSAPTCLLALSCVHEPCGFIHEGVSPCGWGVCMCVCVWRGAGAVMQRAGAHCSSPARQRPRHVTNDTGRQRTVPVSNMVHDRRWHRSARAPPLTRCH